MTDDAIRRRLRSSAASRHALAPRRYVTDIVRRPVVYQRPHAVTAAGRTVPVSQVRSVAYEISVGAPVAQAETESTADAPEPHKRPVLPWALPAMAVIVFSIGLFVSINGWLTNRRAAQTVAHLSQAASSQHASGTVEAASTTVPSTDKPAASSISSYTVAPTKPRFLIIPKIGVHARVLQVGLGADGAIGTPSNVYDAGWYTGSSLPGQPGATLIDGHISSWTTNGVFYDLKKLAAGDTLSVERGDGKVFTYKVVKTAVYDASNVDMQAASTPVTAGKPGLNLITCTGKVKPGTSEFTQRLVVFAEQM